MKEQRKQMENHIIIPDIQWNDSIIIPVINAYDYKALFFKFEIARWNMIMHYAEINKEMDDMGLFQTKIFNC